MRHDLNSINSASGRQGRGLGSAAPILPLLRLHFTAQSVTQVAPAIDGYNTGHNEAFVFMLHGCIEAVCLLIEHNFAPVRATHGKSLPKSAQLV